ncbi:MAG: MraY family glycosyltransferase, partial [Planctomycetota bacterium]
GPHPMTQAALPTETAPDEIAGASSAFTPPGAMDIFHDSIFIFVVAFIVTVCATPVMRRIALAAGIVDAPTEARKAHRVPVAYLGGVAVFLGVFAAVVASYLGGVLPDWLYVGHDPYLYLPLEVVQTDRSTEVPLSIVLGMAVITLVGFLDDVTGLDPRLKIAGQLLAAAAMALEDVGVKVAEGIMAPVGEMVGNPGLTWAFDLPVLGPTEFDLIYWAGTAIIAVFVLGSCNAANLIDGLDGLLSGVTAIAAGGMLVIALLMASAGDGPLDNARIVMCLAVMGACMGFLCHNFNPATIFLGDCGSLLLGFMTIAIVLTMGDTGKTHFVVAGLVIWSIPIIDTVLAIVRRKLAGVSMSTADAHHLHHMLKRALGVKGAVLTLYGIGLAFGAVGVWMTFGRTRVVMTVAVVLIAFIGVTAVKIARKQQLEQQAIEQTAKRALKPLDAKRAPSDDETPAEQRA